MVWPFLTTSPFLTLRVASLPAVEKFRFTVVSESTVPVAETVSWIVFFVTVSVSSGGGGLGHKKIPIAMSEMRMTRDNLRWVLIK